MSSLAPEWIWGLWMTLIGLAIVLGMSARNTRWERIGEFAGFVTWLFIAIILGHSSGWQAVSTPIYALIALENAWCYLHNV